MKGLKIEAWPPQHPLGHFIGGELVASPHSRTGRVFDPATGQVTHGVALASADETRAAITAARKALPAWAALAPSKRARVLLRFMELVRQNAGDLAEMITAEHGKVLADAHAELVRGIEVVEFACGIPHLLKGEFSGNIGSGTDSWSMRQPVGVCIGITPFNFPAMVPMWMFPIAIACGNTFVLKPSERDPSCSLRLAELMCAAGAPAGVLNVVNGDHKAVEALLSDPRVDAVSFVGSTPIARHVYGCAASYGKRVQALGGAKNHLVVMPDADMTLTAKALVGAAYGCAGERCMAISVVAAVGSAADDLVETLRPMIAAIRLGPGSHPGVDVGPLITREHLDRVHTLIRDGVLEGARLVVDGRNVRVPKGAGGFFLGPTLFDHVTPAMRIYREEIFGPVLALVRVSDLASAIELVNTNEFGNGAAIFTMNGGIGKEFSEHVTSGMVGVNVALPVPAAFHSFGGWKRSSFGDLNMHGMDGVRFYTRLKTVTSRWPRSEGSPEFTLPTPG